MIGRVYFIQEDEDGPIKIGFATTPVHTRMKSMQVSNSATLRLLGTIPGRLHDERLWHQKFSDSRKRGEWFFAAPDLLAAIDEVLLSPPVISRRPEMIGDPIKTLTDWMTLNGVSVETMAVRLGYTVNHTRYMLQQPSRLTVGFSQALEDTTEGLVRAHSLLVAAEVLRNKERQRITREMNKRERMKARA